MKALKKVFSTMLVLAFSLSLCLAPCAYAAGGTYVFDEYGVLSSSQVDSLEAQAAQYASDYGQGVYLLITDTMGSSSPSDSQRANFARSYYESNGLGVGSDKSGILFVIAVESRDYVSLKKELGDDPFSDSGVDALESQVVEYLHNDNWSGAAKEYYGTVGEQLYYFASTGKQWTAPDPIGFVLKILATLGIPAAAAGLIVGGQVSAMKTAKEKTEASDYLDQGSLNIIKSDDKFVNTSLIATPRAQEKSGGGGWSDMGGGFSSSGGGKF